MSRRSRESASAGSDRVIQESSPPTYMVATMEESSGVCSVEVLPHVVPDDTFIDGGRFSGTRDLNDSANSTPKRSVPSVVQAEVISLPSDTLSINTAINRGHRPSDTGSLEKSVILDMSKRSSRRGSVTPSLVYPSSPRPGSRGSRRSARGSSRRRRSSKDPPRRGELLADLARHDSVKSRESRRSTRGESMRDRGSSKRRKDSSSSGSSTSISAAGEGPGVAFTRKGRRGFMTAQEAVELGEHICGCMLKDKFLYFMKPFIFLSIGIIMITGGLALTVLHFILEDTIPVGDEEPRDKNPPFFTWGPIALSTGLIFFMVGLVWIPIKEQKWKDGTASPMQNALDKWQNEHLQKEEFQMKEIGEVKCCSSVEKVNETTLITEQPKSEKQDETQDTSSSKKDAIAC